MYKRIDEMHFKLALKQAVTKWIDEEIYKTDITPDTQIELIDEKRMDSLWEKVKRKSKRSNAIIMKVLKYAAMLLICFSLIGATIVISVPTVRAQIKNVIIEVYEKSFGLNFEPNETKPICIEKKMLPTYIPDNWTMECRYSNNMSISYMLTGQKEEQIYFTQSVSGFDSFVENDDVKKENIIINEKDGILFRYPDGRIILIWSYDYVFKINAMNVDLDIVIKIAESVK